MTGGETTAPERGIMTADLPEETRIAIVTTADEDAAVATVAAAAEAGAKTASGTETGTKTEIEIAPGAGPRAGADPEVGVEKEIQERFGRRAGMCTHQLQWYQVHLHHTFLFRH